MSDPIKLAEKAFTAELVRESSFGTQYIGEHASTMTLYGLPDKAGAAFIEWDIPDLEDCVEIGLSFDVRKHLIDYDGVFSLPKEAVALIREAGFIIGESFE